MGEVAIEIIKPRNDKRDYRNIVLPNELRVLLVSDPETDKAGAAMDVNVGSYSDPEQLDGLAHFLEHMLFYSSEKYPVEESYSKFLTEHGGHSNAYTGSEHTNFFFDVNAEHLEGALDRFAQFFICPLMSEDATSREMNAVDSEHSKNLTQDVWRLNQLSRFLSSKDHPFHKFGTGSLETLDVGPKNKGIDTRQELLKFYKAHYSANLMCLAVYGKETLNELQKLAEDKFSAINNTSKEAPQFSGEPCLPEHLQIIVKAIPIKERHMLEISWPFVSDLKNYKVAPARYIGHLLGHEADGSLFALLKSLGWATSLSAGESERSIHGCFFSVSIELTDAGHEHMQEIVAMTFQYIELLKAEGVAEWVFDEIKTVCEMTFHYQDKSPPIHYVTQLANNMQLYPVEDWLAGPLLPRHFDFKTTNDALNLLTASSVRIIWSSKNFEGKTTDVEPWYGTAYSIEKTNDSTWQNLKKSIDSRLHLPVPNPFIPTDFSLKISEPNIHYPILLTDSSLSKLWYKPDYTFGTPKACVIMNLNCPESNTSPEAAALSNLFIKLLLDYLNEYAYYAEIAGLHYSVQRITNGFQVSVSGYSHKLAILLERIVMKFVSLDVKEDRFEIIKEKLLKDFMNFKFQQPYQQVMYYCLVCLEHKRWHINDLLEAIPALVVDDLRNFIPRLLSRIYLDCFVTGNMTGDEAEGLIKRIEACIENGAVKPKPKSSSLFVEERVVRLDSGSDFYFPLSGLNPHDDNSALHVYFQVEQDQTLLNVLVELFVLSAKQAVHHQLRSVQQLGYIVALVQRNDNGVRGLQFIIQSTVQDPKTIDDRVEEFIESFESTLENMSDEEFERNVNALVDVKLEKFKNIWEESSFYWKEIDAGICKFDRREVEVAALKKVEKQQVVDLLRDYLKRNSPKRKKLAIQMFGKLHLQQMEMEEQQQQHLIIKDIFSFRRSQGLHPSLKQ